MIISVVHKLTFTVLLRAHEGLVDELGDPGPPRASWERLSLAEAVMTRM